MSSGAELAAAYDRVAKTYGAVRNSRFDEFRDGIMDRFVEDVNKIGNCVLDLGSGPGHESLLLKERGLNPTAVDFSKAMLYECALKGIRTECLDLRDLGSLGASSAGAWMSFSLLHFEKSETPMILNQVADALISGGVLTILLFEGEGEGYRFEDREKFGVSRYFSYYSMEELEKMISSRFDLIYVERLEISPRPTLVISGRKREEDTPKGGTR